MINFILGVLYICLGLLLLLASALLLKMCQIRKWQIEAEQEAAKQPEFWDENAI